MGASPGTRTAEGSFKPVSDRVQFRASAGKRSKAWGPAQTMSLAAVTFLVFTGTLLAHSIGWRGELFYTPCLLSLLVWFTWRWAPQLARGFRLRRTLGTESQVTSRLTCVGLPAAFESYGDLRDVPFEPEVVRLWFGRPLTVWQAVLVIVTTLPCVALVVFVVRAYISGVQLYWFIPGYLLAFTLIMLMREFVRPMYVRVTPGRLQMQRATRRTFQTVSGGSYDLRAASVTVELVRETVFVEEGDRTLEFSTAFIGDPVRLAFYLFLGAISTYEAPVTPEEQPGLEP